MRLIICYGCLLVVYLIVFALVLVVLVLVCFISLVWFGGCGFVWCLVACCFVFGFTSILAWWFGVRFVCVVSFDLLFYCDCCR